MKIDIDKIPNKCVWKSDAPIDICIEIWTRRVEDIMHRHIVYINKDKLHRFKDVLGFLIYNPN